MAAFIDDIMNKLHANTLLLQESTENVVPVSSVHIDITCPSYGYLENLMFSISGDTATSGPVLVSSSSTFGRVTSLPKFP